MNKHERIERFAEAALMGIMAHGGIVQRGPDAVAMLAVATAKAVVTALDADAEAEADERAADKKRAPHKP